jgi:hypothetical protein
VSNVFEDHVVAFVELIEATGLTVYRSEVPDDPAEQYVLVRAYFETPNGLVAPDAVSLAGASRVLNPRMYVHQVGVTEQSALATAARVWNAVLNVELAIADRVCHPIEWREGQPARPDEDVPGHPVFDQADVYGWRSLPA